MVLSARIHSGSRRASTRHGRRIGRSALLACLVAPLIVTSVLAQAPQVVSVLPARNALGVSTSVDVSVTFDIDMDAATIDAATFQVAGARSGPRAGTISYDPVTRTASLVPAAAFDDGELVTVVLTTAIESTGAVSLGGYVWSFTTASAAAPAVFPERTDTADLGGLRSAAVADLDGDGNADVATADGASGGPSGSVLHVLENPGDGVLAAPDTYWTGSTPWPVLAADVDGDGFVDLLAGSYDDSELSVLINNGDGTFADDVTYPISFGASSLSAADLDRDGDRDVVVGYFPQGVVSVLLNAGGGTFGAATDYVAGTPGAGTWTVVTADLDGDGDHDLAVADNGGDAISVLMNDGDGTFAPRVPYPAGDGPSAVAACDVDGDGHLDLAVASVSSSDVSVLINDGDGTFGTAVSYGVGPEPRGLVAADLDGDTYPDLATANYTLDEPGVSVLLNEGDGTFADAVGHAAGDRPQAIAAADMDGDADLDLVVANRTSGQITVLLNDAIVAVDPSAPVAPDLRIVSASPTPFSPSMTVRFVLSEATTVRAEVLSVAGALVRRLADGAAFGAGDHELTWDGRSDGGAPAASGVYHVRLTTPHGVRSTRVVLLR